MSLSFRGTIGCGKLVTIVKRKLTCENAQGINIRGMVEQFFSFSQPKAKETDTSSL